MAFFKKKSSNDGVPGTGEIGPKGTVLRTPQEGGPELSSLEIADARAWEAKSLPEWEPGQEILDTYKIEDKISGGMGHVYIVHHTKWDRKLAIKAPNQVMLSDRELFARILREAHSWTEMGLHPNIAYCYYVRNIENVPHIVVEYVNGGNLRQWIKEGKCRDYRLNLNLALQFCHGMEYAHGKGMIHRDIKPENVLMTQDGTLKITDFGLVRKTTDLREKMSFIQDLEPPSEANKSQDESLTQWGTFMGTEGYISPEQAASAGEVDERTDMFAFGICLYEMFCRAKPYDITYGPKQEPPEPAALSGEKDFPQLLAGVLKKCTQWDREDRYPNFAALRSQLVKIFHTLYGEDSPYAELEIVGLEADGYNNQGVSYWELGQYEKARRCFEKAVAVEHLHPPANWNLGNIDELNQTLAGDYREPTLDLLRGILQGAKLQTRHIRQLTGWAQNCLGDPFEHYLNNFYSGFALIVNNDREWVNAAVFSPDGRCLASGSEHGIIAVWNTELEKVEKLTDLIVGYLKGSTAAVESLAFSPDGLFLVSAHTDNVLRIWDMQELEPVTKLKLKGTPEGICSAVYSPDGRWLAAGGMDNAIRLWEIKPGRMFKRFTFELSRTLEGHTGPVRCVIFSPDGQLLISGSDDHTIKIWHLEKGGVTREIKAEGISSAAVSPDARHLAVGMADKTIKLWNIETGDLVFSMEGHTGAVLSVSFSFDGRFLVSGSEDRTIRLWDPATGKLLKSLMRHKSKVKAAAFSPDHRFIASVGHSMVQLWVNVLEPQLAVPLALDQLIKKQKEKKQLLSQLDHLITQKEYIKAYNFMAKPWSMEKFHRNSDFFPRFCQVRAKAHEVVDIFTVESCSVLKEFDNRVRTLAFSPDGRSLATAGTGKFVRIWDLERESISKEWLVTESDNHVFSIAFSSDGEWLVTASKDPEIKIWHAGSGKLVKTLEGHTAPVQSIAFSPDGKYLASGSWDKSVILWDIGSGMPIKTFTGHPASVYAVTFSPDGRLLASGSALGEKKSGASIIIRDVESGKPFQELHRDFVMSLAFSPNGQYLAVGKWANILEVWDIKEGIKMHVQHQERVQSKIPPSVNSVSFSSDGKFLASGCDDWTVKIWDIEKGKLLHTLRNHKGNVYTTAFSPDGLFLASGSDDLTTQLWIMIPKLTFQV